MASSYLFGTVTIGANNKTISINSTTVNLTEGDYYIYGPVGNLLDHIASRLSTAHGHDITATLSGAGILTLASSVSFSWQWDSAAIIGFSTSTQTSKTTHVGTHQIQNTWIPDRDPSGSLAPIARGRAQIPFGAQNQTESGDIYSRHDYTLAAQELEFSALTRAKTWSDDSGNHNSLEEFFDNILKHGIPFVYCYAGADGPYYEYVCKVPYGQPFSPLKMFDGSELWWKFKMNLVAGS